VNSHATVIRIDQHNILLIDKNVPQVVNNGRYQTAFHVRCKNWTKISKTEKQK